MDELKPNAANSSPLTPLTFLERAATVYPDSISIIYNKTSYTWSQTYRRCLRLASSLSSIGIRRRDVVSVVSPNTPSMYELHFAVPMSGAILNNINTRLDARAVSVILRHSETKLVFVDYASVSLVLDAISLYFPKHLESVGSPMLVLIDDDDGSSLDAASSSGFCFTYECLIEKGDPGFKWVFPRNEWDPIVLNYTSGTTSCPKGVVHTHRGSFLVTLNSLIDWGVPKQPVYLWTLPMFHSNGWSYPWGIAAQGGTNICLRRVDALNVHRLIRNHNVTHMCGAPVVLNMITNHTETLKNPVHILTGGSPPPESVLLRAEALGFVVSHGYGLTEALGVVVSCVWKSQWNKFPATERARLKSRQGVMSVGMTAVDVVDPDTGISVKRDGSSLGEIVLRGGSIMLGYLKDPIGTRNCIKSSSGNDQHGWFYTGDLAVMHADGYLEIKDRSKDVIISGGENMSSVEIESVLYSNPAINEAAVVARQDEFWGEIPCAFVSLKNELGRTQTENGIIEYCRSRLPHFMVPKIVVFKEDLPKTSTGKIKKFLLREMAKQIVESRVSRM